MPSLSKQSVESNIIQQWEEAGASLATSAARFFDLSILLEKQCTTWGGRASNAGLITRLDSSLGYLQSTLDTQLTQARLSLAKLRNRLSGSIQSLPYDILSEIFIDVVYDPVDRNEPSAVMTRMERRVELIYQRLYSLLSVCTSWRQVGLACRSLWLVVPLVDPDIGPPRPLSTGLSLQRGGNQGLHLVASLNEHSYGRFESLPPHISRFGAITISEEPRASVSISDILEIFLKHTEPALVTSLSISNNAKRREMSDDSDEHPSPPLSFYDTPLEPQFFHLLNSLSVLRLDSVALDWKRTVFSSQLVVLQIGRVTLGNQQEANIFVSALGSAKALRDLSLITIRASLERNRDVTPNSLVLPKLESLYIEDLYINVLEFFMGTLAPGPYHLTLNISPGFPSSYFMEEGDLHAHMEYAGRKEVHERLRTIRVHKLIISMEESSLWNSPAALRSLLKRLPRLKTLVMNSYDLDEDILKALIRPPRPPSWKVTHDDLFPKLETVEFHYSTIMCQFSRLKKGFKKLLSSHPLRRIALGTYGEDHEREALIDEHQEMIEWLKAAVQTFRLFRNQSEPPERSSTWQLWDV